MKNCAYTQTFLVIPVGEIFSTIGNNVPRDTMLGGERAGAGTHSGGKVMMETQRESSRFKMFFIWNQSDYMS